MDRYTTRAPSGRFRPVDRVELGPDLPPSAERRLLGDLSGKRVLELGCGCGNGSVAMARAGARVIGVDEDEDQLVAARELFEAQDVRVETHHGDLADLAFARADSFDLAVSVYELADADDLGRVFRQVHRVLRPECAFVLTLPHPLWSMLDDEDGPLVRRYHDAAVTTRVGEVCTGLVRAGFRVDEVLEPDAGGIVPRTLAIRSRKQGI